MNGDVYNEPRYAKEIVGAGAITGIVGGLVLAIATMIIARVVGVPAADFARGISAVFRGEAAMTGGVGHVVLGIVVHFAVSIAFGVLFAWLIGRATDPQKSIAGAIAYAIAIWAIMIYIVVRAAAPQLASALEPVPWWTILLAHLAFGLPLAASPRIQRSIGRVPGERGEPEHEWVGRTYKVPPEGKKPAAAT